MKLFQLRSFLSISQNITGDDVAYLYPWYELGLSGRFEENVMKEARLAQVISTRCQDGFMDVDLQVDPQQADITYDFDPATNDTISSRPTLQVQTYNLHNHKYWPIFMVK